MINLKILSAFVVCCKFLLALFNKVKYRDQTVSTQIRLLLYEQSNLGLYCLFERLLKTFQQTTKADDFCCDRRFKS